MAAQTTLSQRLRRLRVALVGVVLLSGVTLVGSAWLTWSAVNDASRALAEAQGRALTASVLGEVRSLGTAPTDADLQDIIEEYAESGLRAVALYPPDRQATAQAGTPLEPWPDRMGPRTQPNLTHDASGIVRLVERIPPWILRPPPSFDRKPDRRSRRDARRRHDRNRTERLPILILEFEPVLARHLESDARLTLGVGAAVTLLMVLVAILLWRALASREAVERKLLDERHLASIGHMSATLAHEIRNPLASLKGHAQLLAATLPEASKERSKAERLVGDVERLEALSTGLLDFVRSNKVDRQPVDIGPLLRTAIDAAGHERVTLELGDGPDTWSLDAQRMHQLLVNLIQNALQASEGAVQVAVSSRREQLVIEVRDHGEGLPDDVESLFEPFYTTRTRGTGLGLPMARQIASAHGGDIGARNHEDGGAVFTVSIPRDRSR